MQWLNKWDEFRHVKAQYVEKALLILKNKRRLINLITIMKAKQIIMGIKDNFAKLLEWNMNKLNEILIAIKLKVRYQRRYTRWYGEHMEFRNLNYIRRIITFVPQVVGSTAFCRAGDVLIDFLRDAYMKTVIRGNIYHYIKQTVYIQQSFRKLVLRRRLNVRYGYLRFKAEFDRLHQFYLKRAKKSKNAAKICGKLNDINFDDVPTIMWIEKFILDYRKYKQYRQYRKYRKYRKYKNFDDTF